MKISGSGPMVGLFVLACMLPGARVQAEPPTLEEALGRELKSGDHVWGQVLQLAPSLTANALFRYALAIGETGENMDRLPRMLDTAARMQDRDPDSRHYGNFRWYWRDGAVLDANAVEFSMQAASLLWIRDKKKLPVEVRDKLQEIFGYAVEGCLRHRVPSSYTNIALMNAENLILLGEALGKKKAADEGYRRLDDVVTYTWQKGIHEYDSPTYYGVDLDCLMLIEAYCQRGEGRQAARALLELFWKDLALNWYDPAQRLGGARSRDYDFLSGLGYLDAQMWLAGWLEDARPISLYGLLSRWRPPAELRQLNRTRYPRLVRQRWGLGPGSTKTHYVCRDVTLSVSGANYGPMDFPLTVDFPGARTSLRCYFIPDARRDPYGKKKIAAGPHEKTLHLRPLFVGAQKKRDALGLVVYRPRDYPPNPATLESHFVMPLDVDELWVGGSRVALDVEKPFVQPVEPGQTVLVRKGTAALGIRVPWSRGLDGRPAPCALVYDGNPWGALRLTVAHHSFWGLQETKALPGAVFWLRIGSALKTEADFERWRQGFEKARVSAEATGDHLEVVVEGQDGTVAVAAAKPFLGPARIDPAPTEAVLELDGQDVGRPLLAALPVVQRFEARQREAPAIVTVPPDQGVGWEAESGRIEGAMKIGQDDKAFGGKFIWMPGAVGEESSGNGSATYHLQLQKAGTYWLWGRVLTPTPQDDSFFLRIFSAAAEPVAKSAWHTGVHEQWEWTRVALELSPEPTALDLPAGDLYLQVLVREDGAKLDRLYLSPREKDAPK